MSGLIPDNANIRLDQNTDTMPDGTPIDIELAPEPALEQDNEILDDKGNLIKIEHSDGSITINLDGMPLRTADEEPAGWYSNLADKIDPMELGMISEDLLQGIADDEMSRKEYMENYAEAMKLLGTKIELPSTNAPADGAAVEGMSRVRHPLLLEAVLRFQANARSEMLPTDGPVKIRDDNNNSTVADDALADALERDYNHYLTKTDKAYYPDTDRMLFKLGFGGMMFKKVFYCPLRNRPVSESVDVNDFIVNNETTDLSTSKRYTHKILMSPSTVRRMQLMNVYRDVDLPTPSMPSEDAVRRETKEQQGISDNTLRPERRDREIYECYCELDIKGFEHKWKGQPSGLEVPYRVTIDVTSRQILAICRNYRKPEPGRFPEAKKVFVPYIFIPGFGFYGMGLAHILGNTTNALTAAWREMLDLGMFANFPGFLFSKSATRQQISIFRVPPGGGAPIETNGQPIGDAVMALPYKTEGMPALMALTEKMEATGQRVGNTAELQVGEGKQDAPVGTTLALIEQATKVENAVHKRLHAAQAEEFQLLGDCFRDHPESFWQCNNKPAKQWDNETFLKALSDCNLVPQADPNTASHTQRIMKIVALKQLQAANPTLYDPIAVEKEALRVLGFNNPEQFFAPPAAQAKPPPEIQAKQAELQLKNRELDIKEREAQNKTGLAAGELQLSQQAEENKTGLAAGKLQLDKQMKKADIHSKMNSDFTKGYIQLIDLAQNIAVHPESAPLIEPLIRPAFEEVKRQTDEQRQESGLGAGNPLEQI